MTPIKKRIEKSKSDFVKAFELSACNISLACKKVKISRETFYRWCKEDDTFTADIREHSEALLDMAETVLLKGVRAGKTAELLFFLKTQGKDRGYVERFEQKHEIRQEIPLFPNIKYQEKDEKIKEVD